MSAAASEPDDPPDRPLSDHPNFVTADGMSQIELALARAQHALTIAEAAHDRAAVPSLRRDIRYWTARRATAQVVAAPDAPRSDSPSQVRFGAKVTVASPPEPPRTWRIVGEDEADPDRGNLSYVSPLAQALVGAGVGDTVEAEGRAYQVVAIA